MKEKLKNKKGLIIGIVIAVLLIIIGVLSYFLFFGDKVTINTDGGKVVSNIEITDGEITTLPVIEKEGYEVVAFVDENNKIISKGTKVSKNPTIKPVYVKKGTEKVHVKFYDGEKLLYDLSLAKGSNLLLPIDLEQSGFTFGGWRFENNVMLIGNPVINEDISLYAVWISEGKEMVTVTIMSDSTVLGKYQQEKGSNLRLPSPTKKEGYVFEEWQDAEGNVVTSETIIEKDITIHAVFAKYNCPENCEVNADGKTCSKKETKNKETKKVCPSGAFEYYGKCITLKGAGDARVRQCAAGPEFGNKEVYYKDYCAKVVQRVTKKTCPSGYKEDGDKCTKTTTVNCTKAE